MAFQILFGVFFSLLELVTITGNLLVCLAIYKDSRLHRPDNLFLASLAVTDLLVAVLVMTFAGIKDIMGYWMFGQHQCDLWIALDIMCSTASILNLCAVSFVRYLHIKDPYRYNEVVTNEVVALSILTIWVLSVGVSALPIALGHHQTTRTSGQPVCTLDLSPAIAIISSLISFFIPTLIMICVYHRLYLYSQQHAKNISHLSPSLAHVDHKASVTIGVLMGVFLVCWLPFFCINILAAFCKSCVHQRTFQILSWLGYSNSMFNPIVYSVFNSEFRDTFKLLLSRRLSQQTLSSIQI